MNTPVCLISLLIVIDISLFVIFCFINVIIDKSAPFTCITVVRSQSTTNTSDPCGLGAADMANGDIVYLSPPGSGVCRVVLTNQQGDGTDLDFDIYISVTSLKQDAALFPCLPFVHMKSPSGNVLECAACVSTTSFTVKLADGQSDVIDLFDLSSVGVTFSLQINGTAGASMNATGQAFTLPENFMCYCATGVTLPGSDTTTPVATTHHTRTMTQHSRTMTQHSRTMTHNRRTTTERSTDVRTQATTKTSAATTSTTSAVLILLSVLISKIRAM